MKKSYSKIRKGKGKGKGRGKKRQTKKKMSAGCFSDFFGSNKSNNNRTSIGSIVHELDPNKLDNKKFHWGLDDEESIFK